MRRRGILAQAVGGDRGTRSGRRGDAGRARPRLEALEDRIVLSVGGGWVTGTQAGSTGVGFYGRYYDAPGLSESPSLTRWDDRVAFFSADGSAGPGASPGSGLDDGDWSAAWSGTLIAGFDESYTFVVDSAGDGVRLWVSPEGQGGGLPIIDDRLSVGQERHTYSMTLVAGQRYDVRLEYSYSSGVQQVGLQWFSRSTPLEYIEPATQVGVNVDSQVDGLYADLVNTTTRSWMSLSDPAVAIPVDAESWPTSDGRILLGLSDSALTTLGGTYTVQFAGMATATLPSVYRWASTGGNVLQAGQGYDPATNRTTAVMVVPPGAGPLTLALTNSSRRANPGLRIVAIGQSGYDVTVTPTSLTGVYVGKKVTISGFTGAAAGYNGTFTITGVDPASGTFKYRAAATKLPANPSGGKAFANPGDGVTDLHVMRPATAGGDDPAPVGTLFNPTALEMFAQYSMLRLMDLGHANGNLETDWSDRTSASSNLWGRHSPTASDGIYAGTTLGVSAAGAPWEVQIALANAVGKDVYISVPSNASIDYIKNLADLFAYGSDGVNPYAGPRAHPVWKPLNSNLKVYIEFSNELWNAGFVQAASRSDGWANQLGQRALYDYLTGNRDDPLYPGGGSRGHDDGVGLAAYLGLTPANAGAFLATYNPRPSPGSGQASPRYFSNGNSTINGYNVGQAWIGLRTVQIAEAFKATFGESGLASVAAGSRVRPVVQWQYSGLWSRALDFIDAVYGPERPVSYYLYGGGGGWYADSLAGGFADVGFANPSFLDGLAGWATSGPAGPVADGSALGNPAPPPHFVPIAAVAGGATQTGDVATITTTTRHGFSVGQSVKVAGVSVAGYNGTFTITAATGTTFSYRTTAVGLPAGGGGRVVGASAGSSAAYLAPGGSISQDVAFSGGYADITLVATQVFAGSTIGGLTITLVPTNGGPAINGGRPIALSEGATGLSGNKNAYIWSRTEAFYTGDTPFTYRVTFANTSTTQTTFLTDIAVQTVNGLFEETAEILRAGGLDVGRTVRPDVDLALRHGLYTVGYEGGFDFNQNQAGYNSPLGYQTMASRGFSSNVPNVGMYANLDPRAKALAAGTLGQFYAAGGTLPIVFQTSGNINSWGLQAPYFSDWDTPRQQAALEVAGGLRRPEHGLKSGEPVTNGGLWWLASGAFASGTYLVRAGDYALDVSFGSNSAAPVGQLSAVKVYVDGRLVATLDVPVRTGGRFTVLVPGLSAGQHSVRLINAGASTNAMLSTGKPGTPLATLSYQSEAQSPPTIAKTSPAITILNSARSFTYGDDIYANWMGAVANVPGTFSISTSSYYFLLASSSLLSTGVHSLQILFTPADLVHYTTSTALVTLSIDKARPTVFVSAGGRYVDSTSAVTGAVAGIDARQSSHLEGVSPTLLYYRGDVAIGDPLPSPPTSAGVYTVVAVFPGSSSYLPAEASATFTIVSAPAITPVLSSSISSVDVAFSEPVDLATFDWRDLWLARDGGSNLMSDAVTIALVTRSTYRINGLGGITAIDGRYTLIVDGAGIIESSGRPSLGQKVFSWIKDVGVSIVMMAQGSSEVAYSAAAVASNPVVPDEIATSSLTARGDDLDGSPTTVADSAETLPPPPAAIATAPATPNESYRSLPSRLRAAGHASSQNRSTPHKLTRAVIVDHPGARPMLRSAKLPSKPIRSVASTDRGTRNHMELKSDARHVVVGINVPISIARTAARPYPFQRRLHGSA